MAKGCIYDLAFRFSKQFLSIDKASLCTFSGLPMGLKPFIYAIVPDNDATEIVAAGTRFELQKL